VWDVDRGVRLYQDGWTLREIAAEFGIAWPTVRTQLKRAGVIMRGRGTHSFDVSTTEIIRLRDDERLTWSQVGERVGMTGPGAQARYRRAHLEKSSPWAADREPRGSDRTVNTATKYSNEAGTH
jgi:hypothetical protein